MKYVRPLSLFHYLLKTSAINQGRLLGLDVGDKYVGLAVSDPLNKIASPLRCLLRITVVFHFPYNISFFLLFGHSVFQVCVFGLLLIKGARAVVFYFLCLFTLQCFVKEEK